MEPIAAALNRRLDGLRVLSPPGLAQVALWGLLLCGGVVAWTGPLRDWTQPVPAERVHYLTLVGLLLPDRWLASVPLQVALRGVFLVAAVGWALRRALPWTAWTAFLSFLLFSSMIQEGIFYVEHTANVANVLLGLLCLWQHLYRRELAAAGDELWRAPLCPRWVPALSAFYLCTTYGYAGLNKLAASGARWADGVGLQTWTFLYGDRTGPLARLVLWDRPYAAALQVTVLLAETLAFTGIFSLRARLAVGGALLLFHLGSEAIFGFGFFSNVVAIAIFMIAHPARLLLRR